jgi:hypothetical protein
VVGESCTYCIEVGTAGVGGAGDGSGPCAWMGMTGTPSTGDGGGPCATGNSVVGERISISWTINSSVATHVVLKMMTANLENLQLIFRPSSEASMT